MGDLEERQQALLSVSAGGGHVGGGDVAGGDVLDLPPHFTAAEASIMCAAYPRLDFRRTPWEELGGRDTMLELREDVSPLREDVRDESRCRS